MQGYSLQLCVLILLIWARSTGSSQINSTTSKEKSAASRSASTEDPLGFVTSSTRSLMINSSASTEISLASSSLIINSSASTERSLANSSLIINSSASSESSLANSSLIMNSLASTDSSLANSRFSPESSSANSISTVSSFSLPNSTYLMVSLAENAASTSETSQSTSSITLKSSLSPSAFSTLSTVRTPSPLTSACGPAPETLTGWNGSVQWTGVANTKCKEPRTWEWQLPPDHGIIINLRSRHHCVVRLYQMIFSRDQTEMKEVYKWSGYRFPIAVVRGKAVMKVQATDKSPSFKLDYAVYLLSRLPQKVDFQSEIASSVIMFNCSAHSPVSDALACDGVIHCIGDEDEKDCAYRKKGCGNWVPYQNHCLKLDVLRQGGYKTGQIPVSLPTNADKECQKKYGATLAALPDKEGTRLVAAMMHQSGVSLAAVNLRKANPVSKKHMHLYRYTWQWGKKGSPIAYKQTDIQTSGIGSDCAMLSIYPNVHFEPISCLIPSLKIYNLISAGYVCMKPNPKAADTNTRQTPGVHFKEATRRVTQLVTKPCADGSVVQRFHQCQWQGHVLSSQRSPRTFPLFQCQYGPPVHYTLVCDGLPDCVDGSDETGCLFPHLLNKNNRVLICENRQVIPKHRQCDGVADCFDGTDEVECASCQQSRCIRAGCVPWRYVKHFESSESCTYVKDTPLFPDGPVFWSVSVVDQDGFGMSDFKEISKFDSKLQNYFPCKNGMYLPAYLLNNGERDCLGGEDENIPLNNFTCPGFYRCQYYGNCIHADFVCDGINHCPNKDDERYCGLSHPPNCTCEGYVCSCQAMPWPVPDFWYLRYLDLSGVEKPALDNLFMLGFLRFLNASFCNLDNATLVYMSQLNVLDLSFNALWGLSSIVMKNLTGLTHLNLTGNPLVTTLDAAFSFFLKRAGSVSIQHLVMRNTHIRKIEDNAFSVLHHLDSLDIRNNELERYSKGVFGGLVSLDLLHTDESSLCCSYFHPKPLQCYAPSDELSSCNDLLRTNLFRGLLWGISFLTTLGNVGVFVYKVVSMRNTNAKPYQIFVSHLCVADFLMGVYMIIIGAADAYFRGNYVANERKWKQSSACFAAGFLAFVSSEVSALIICSVTLDRLLTLCFPFKSHIHMSGGFSKVLCCMIWALGLLLAAVPFIGQFEFYGESSICLPLPITRHQFSGQIYAFVVFIVLNFLLFLFIGAGQLAIYWAVRRAKAAVKSQRQKEQSSIAQRLFLVVFTDFCCWFPVGVMGILASAGVPVPGEVSVWVAVFVLPLNSALNPFLYTLNSLKERWRIRKINQKSQRILCNLNGEISKLAPNTVEEMMLMYLRSNKSVKLDKVSNFLQSHHGKGNCARQTRNTSIPKEESTCDTQQTALE